MLPDALSNLLEDRLELDRVLEEILEQAIAIMGAERGFVVYLKGRHNLGVDGAFECLAAKDFDHSQTDDPIIGFSRTVVAEVVRNREPVVLMDALNSEKFGPAESISKLGLRSIAALPLVVEDEVVGALYLENRTMRGVFKESELGLLSSFARVAAMALANTGVIHDCDRAIQESSRKTTEEVLRSFSRELRTPLNTILGFAQLLDQTEPLTERQRHYLNQLKEGVGSMASALDTLLYASWVDLETPLDLVELDLASLLQESVEGLETMTQARGIQLELNSLPSPVKVDRELVLRMFGSLLRNAIEHSREDGRVAVTVEPSEGGYLISFRDFGSGIPLQEQERVFLKFEQGKKSGHKGLGLGLYLSKRVAELHRGRLWLESTGSEDGCQFNLWLPGPN